MSFSNFLLSLISYFLPLWKEQVHANISVFRDMLRLVLGNIPCVLEKNLNFAAIGWDGLYMSDRASRSIVYFKSDVSLLVCYL